MLLTSDRTSPCSARFSRSSSGRSTTSVSPSWRTVMAPGRSRSSTPLGPRTVMCRPATDTSTPLGTGMGDLPTRDMGSPHEAQDLAADVALARLAVGEQALAGREDRDAQPAEDPRDLGGPRVDA